MKYREIKKLIGVVATASVLSSCGTTLDQDNTIQNNTSEVMSSVATAEQSEVVTSKNITISYDQSDTETDSLTISDEAEDISYTIKDYVAPIFYPYMENLGYEYTFNEEEGSLYLGERLISDNVEVNEDGTLNVRDYMLEDAIPVVKYVRTGENDNEVEARYITMVPIESHMVSGITFVMEKGESGTYTMTGMLGVFGEDITKLPAWEGTFDGWSMEVGGEVIFSAGDSVKIGDSMNLYPHFQDREINILADEDGRVPSGQIEEIDGLQVLRIVHIFKYAEYKDGNQKTVAAYALDGLNVDADTVKNTDGSTIDKDKVKEQQKDEVKEAEEKKKAEEEQKKKEEETKKKQEESKKKESGGGSGNGSSSQKPSGNSGQSGNNVSNETPTNDTSAGAAAWGFGGGSVNIDDIDCKSGITGE